MTATIGLDLKCNFTAADIFRKSFAIERFRNPPKPNQIFARVFFLSFNEQALQTRLKRSRLITLLDQ